MLKVNDNGSFKREREKKSMEKSSEWERERKKQTNSRGGGGGALEIISVEKVVSGNFKFKFQEGGERK